MRLRAILAVAVLATGLGTAVNAEADVQPTNRSVVALGAGGFDFSNPEVLATGLEAPWGLDFLPDGSALVAQRDRGTVVRVRPGLPPVQVAQIPGVVAGGEAGLLGLAVSRATGWTGGCTSASPPPRTSGSPGSDSARRRHSR
ncbi:hypothetical protein GCM10027614_66660 [Micromonospora vulcania]